MTPLQLCLMMLATSLLPVFIMGWCCLRVVTRLCETTRTTTEAMLSLTEKPSAAHLAVRMEDRTPLSATRDIPGRFADRRPQPGSA